MATNGKNWSKEAKNAFNSVKNNISGFISYGKRSLSEVADDFHGNVIEKYLTSAAGCAQYSQQTRALMHMLCFDADKLEADVHVSLKNKKSVEKMLSQVEPILPYVSKKFLLRLSKSLNSVNSKSKNKEIDTISKISEKGKLTDYLMKFVTDVQLSNHFNSEALENEADEFVHAKCAKRCKKSVLRKNTATQTDDDSDECDDIKIISALKVENQKLRKQIERSNVSGGNDHLLIERIEDAIREIGNDAFFTKKAWTGGSTFKKNEHGTAVLHLSDWHIGSKECVNGFNEFDYDVAKNRVEMLANKYIDWTKMHRSMYNIEELVVLVTGDMISGDIHDELIRTNEFSVPQQCVKASELLAKLVNELSGVFKKVRVEFIVADNHSRTTAKIEFGDGTNSYNYIVGYMSKFRLSNNKSVEFNIYPEIQKVVKVENLKYLITHGNCVRGGFAGIPFYSMQRKVGAEASIRMNMPQDFHFDKIVMGHYHVPMRSTQYEMTGCLSSTTMFDHAAGRHCRACQTAWIVSKDNELDYFEIWLS